MHALSTDGSRFSADHISGVTLIPRGGTNYAAAESNRSHPKRLAADGTDESHECSDLARYDRVGYRGDRAMAARHVGIRWCPVPSGTEPALVGLGYAGGGCARDIARPCRAAD